MPNLNDWLQSEAHQRAQARLLHNAEETRRRLHAVQAQAQTVVNHEGWQTFLNTLEAQVQERQRKHDSLAQRLVEGPDLGASLDQLKLDLVRLGEQIKTIRQIADVIPHLLRDSEEAERSPRPSGRGDATPTSG